jgi:hypothetical protein
VKIVEKITTLFRRRPPTDDERAARAEAEALRQHTQEQAAELATRERRF